MGSLTGLSGLSGLSGIVGRPPAEVESLDVEPVVEIAEEPEPPIGDSWQDRIRAVEVKAVPLTSSLDEASIIEKVPVLGDSWQDRIRAAVESVKGWMRDFVADVNTKVEAALVDAIAAIKDYIERTFHA